MTTTDGSAPTPVLGANVKQPADTDTPNCVFAALQREWIAVGSGPSARRAMRAWARAAPAIDGFASPAELVTAIGRPGDPARCCALLSELLVIAGTDELAARAVLQAIAPGLRQAARRRWQPTTAGPWTHADDVAADAVSAAWTAIAVHAGQLYERPAALIIRAVEGQLRRTHDAWRRHTVRAVALPATDERSGPDAARTAAEQAGALIIDASRAGVLDQTGALLLFATGVLGYTVAEAARMIGADGHAAYRCLDRARASLRAWVEDRSDVMKPRPEAAPALPPRRPRPSPSVAMSWPPNADHLRPIPGELAPLLVTPLQAAGLLGISRSKLYAVIKEGEIPSVTIGASRRIPHRDLVDYVERRREDERRRHPPADPASDRTAAGAAGHRRTATDPEVDNRDRQPPDSAPIGAKASARVGDNRMAKECRSFRWMTEQLPGTW